MAYLASADGLLGTHFPETRHCESLRSSLESVPSGRPALSYVNFGQPLKRRPSHCIGFVGPQAEQNDLPSQRP